MPAAEDLTGRTFSRLTVIRRAEQEASKTIPIRWVCRCACGNEHEARGALLKNGEVQSCGCLLRESAAQNGRAKRTHGMTGSRTYSCWVNMKTRCLNEKNEKFKDYGGRGITICERWMQFALFLEDMGEAPPGMTIERDNVDGNYDPGNCIWATQKTQQNNRRNTVFVTLNGEQMTLSEACARTGVNRKLADKRLRKGWPDDKALAP